MSVPDYQSLMFPVLSVASGGAVRISDAVDKVAEQLKLSQEDRLALLPSGRQTVLSNRVPFCDYLDVLPFGTGNGGIPQQTDRADRW
jgi:restriction system protein